MEGENAGDVLGCVKGELEGVAGGAVFEFFPSSSSISLGLCQRGGPRMECILVREDLFS